MAKQKIAKVFATYSKAKTVYQKSPKDSAKRAAYVTATTQLADTYMTILGLAPKQKYPNALKYYREVLKIEPKNKHAQDSANIIISIYKSLGKPVPKP